jgi:hypothetical protein
MREQKAVSEKRIRTYTGRLLYARGDDAVCWLARHVPWVSGFTVVFGS